MIITGLSAGVGLAATGLTLLSLAAAVEPSYDFSSVIFSGQFSDRSDFSTSRWRDDRSEPEFCASYDWGVFMRDTRSISSDVGHVLRRKRTIPFKGLQNRFDKEPTLRYINQTFVTTQGLFPLVYGSLRVRAHFPQPVEGLFTGIWLRTNDDDNGGEINVMETHGGGSATGIAESTVYYGQVGGEGDDLGVPSRPDPTQ